MTVEEKKAIDIINYIKNKTPFIFWYENKPYNRKETIETVLKLIEKQQKELEQEKARNEKLQYKIDEKELIIDGMKEDRRIAIEEIREEYYISKDKIKEKIVEIINSSARYNVLCKINENEETRRTRYAVAVLKELLEGK